MAKVQVWTLDEAKKELSKRLSFCRQSRKGMERLWQDAERTVYGTGYSLAQRDDFNNSLDISFTNEGVDSSNVDVNISYAFKNIRFLHAQMAANPPSTVATPASNDPSDRQKASAASKLLKYGLKHYKIQEFVDRTNLNCLVYGTGVMKSIWDSSQGAILEVDDEGNFLTEGDITFSVPSIWDIYLDPDASSIDEIRYVFERKHIPYEEACFYWPEKKDIFEKLRKSKQDNDVGNYETGESTTFLRKAKYDVVEVFEYWEKGLPTNAYLGKFCICLPDGTIIKEPIPSPFRFKPSDDSKARYQVAKLPYTFITDIDIPNSAYGKSILDYASPLQQNMNRLDSLNLDNIQAHGVTRLILPESAEIAEQITTSPYDVVRITGNQPPHFMSAPSSMPSIDNLREQHKIGIDDMFGVNESMMGQQSRETAGFAMQFATNQGNMIRHRLFVKYRGFVEALYNNYLNLIRKHWETPKIINVMGKEKALDAVQIKGADIENGFDLTVEYGTEFSLDPASRRQEIVALQPLFEKAGVSTRTSLRMMRLSELEGLYDASQMAEDRQREIFEEMIASHIYIPPEEFQDHENMLAYALQYVMTSEFKYLDDTSKELIRQHMRDRGAQAAKEKAPNPGGPLTPGPGPDQAPSGSLPPPSSPIEGGQEQLNAAPPNETPPSVPV